MKSAQGNAIYVYGDTGDKVQFSGTSQITKASDYSSGTYYHLTYTESGIVYNLYIDKHITVTGIW